MDKDVLVKAGHLIMRELGVAGYPPTTAMWVHSIDTDTWKLWIIPPKSLTDKREFYRILSSITSKYRTELGGVDAADAEMISDAHPAIRGMGRAFKVKGPSSVFITNSTFNGFYLPEAIILEMNPL